MTKDKRKSLRLWVQSHAAASPLRKSMENAAFQLPALDRKFDDKIAGLTRLLNGAKMPKRVVQLHKGYFAVRPCVSGIVFTAAVFPSLGHAENHKIVAPMARLSDALAYHFRHSRMRSGLEYNLSLEQAIADEKILRPVFAELEKMLTECGVPVINESPSPSPISSDSLTLTKRVDELEKLCHSLQQQLNSLTLTAPVATPVVIEPTPTPLPNAPTVWCEAKL